MQNVIKICSRLGYQLYRNVIVIPVLIIRFFIWHSIGMVKGIGVALIDLVMPDHTKRLLFLSSLYTMIEKERNHREVSPKMLDELNNTLRLTDYADAVNVGSVKATSIWDETALKQCVGVCEKKQTRASIENIARLAPKWMLYGTVDGLVKDIEDVLKLSRTNKAA